jgi:hypothetical protein
MNFGWMVGHITSLWVFLVYGIGSLLACSVIVYGMVRRSGYLDPTSG